ncbi:MAG TPA: chromosome segregation protein SMC, partial [Chloroflexota bacterium]|nr:chromosome segregation protein SMC [Chloroflexota bacterium]
YVNRERSRLRDVVDLFARVGLGLDGFSLVGQGAMDAALSLRAEDRRALIEQAAAIGHLHTRLDDARERLEQTRTNLARIVDLIAEVTPRRELLARQAAQVRERAALNEALESDLLRWYAHLLVAPRRRAQQADEARERLTTLRAATDRTCREASDEVARERQAVAGTAEQLRLGRADADAARREEGALAQATALADERERGLRQRAAQTAEQLGALHEELAREDAGSQDDAAQHAALLDTLAVAEKELSALEREAATWEEVRTRREGELRRARHRLSDLEAACLATSSRRQAVDERLQHVESSRQEREGKREALAREHLARQAQLAERAEPLRAARDALALLLGERPARIAEVDAAKAAVEELARRTAAIDRELATVQARVDALRSVEEAGTGYFAGVRAVLQASRAPKARLNGIVGVVARLLTVRREHELALETALGSHSQDLVVEHWTDAESAIAFLKTGGTGRATFLPLDTLRPPRRQVAPATPGVVGLACDLVHVEEHCAIIADYLLGQTLVVESLAVARQILRACPPSWQIVTLEGDLSRASGVVTGGAPATNRGSLGRHRERREADAQCASLVAQREQLTGELSTAQEAEANAARQLNETLRQIRATEEAVRQTEAAQSEAQRQLDRAAQNLTWHLDELRRLDEQRAAAENARSAARQAEAGAVREHAAARDAVGMLEAALEAARPPRDLLAAVYDKRSQRDIRRERIRAIEAASKRQNERLRALNEQIHQAKAREEALSVELAALGAERSRLSHQHVEWRGVVAECDSRVAALTSAFSEAETRLVRREAALREADASRQKLAAEWRDADSAAERAAQDLAGVLESVRDDLGDPDEAALTAGTLRVAADESVREAAIRPLDHPVATRERIATLRARVHQLPNDPAILSEFDAVCERLRFLDEQVVDLGRTAATLTEAIDETREAMRSRFGETFGAVSAAFERRFVDLFGGGTARLSLDGGEDLPGVEIVAQPPGKRSQSLGMLSGGERALTAAALLFSLIETNPPPFCVLDEVDAALDESNVTRFCTALRGLAQRTQFVVITHNRRTMEAAGTIYGLTLENKGESRVLSLRLPSTVG